MTTAAELNHKARRLYNASLKSLIDAEGLLRHMESGDQTNAYIADQTRKAAQLVAEMEEDLQFVMDRWTPAECGIDD